MLGTILKTLPTRILSLQSRLVVGLGVTWALVAGLLLGSAWQSGQLLVRESNYDHLRYEARLIADDITQQVSLRLSVLESLAARLSSGRNDDAMPQALLRDNQALLGLFEGLVIGDADGTIVADWPVVAGRVGLDVSHREYARFMEAVKRPYVSEPFIGLAGDEPLIMVLVPRVDEQGQYAGFVGGLVEVLGGELFRRLDRIRLGKEGFAAVMSSSGRVLYHPDQKRVLQAVPDRASHPWLGLAMVGWEGEARAPLPDGEMALQAYRQIWPADWVVGVYLPLRQVEAPLAQLIRRLGGHGLLLALLLLPLIGWLLWLVLRPLHRLEGQLDEIGRGQRQRLALDTRMCELSRIVEAYNRTEDEREQALARLHDRQAFLDAVLASSPQGMFVTDMDGRITYMNQALVELTGYREPWSDGLGWVRPVHPEDRPSVTDQWRYSLASGEDFLRQFRYVHRDGEELWLEVHAGQVALDGHTIGFVGSVKDITERRHQEALRRWEAEHDPLTGLLNRRGFDRRLEEALADWQETGTPAALLMFDLDHFKRVNDEGGHALGDEMLRRIAEAVGLTVRRSDQLSRRGGDEFGVLLPGCTRHQAVRIAQTLCSRVEAIVVEHGGREYRVTLSIGVTLLREGDRTVTEVLQRADAASYRSKASGRNRVTVA
ncbi:sensor domain-containing diguanylate cyclase [Halomonas ramblicola]|uniref:sensor domain-containing diguanylate cyclase n=1 Tax=Halomonas ramblicola TaxID=747349 RepID=UPI0025B4DF13|nr:diguanylate cyclase [Halomonas ramblicola]MDN3523306.1 diguanylate cyclase [Halomonas ramblicola]